MATVCGSAAAILVIAGIFAIIRKQLLWGIVDVEWITEN